jgi:hypothetical protein
VDGPEDGADRGRLALGAQDRGRLGALGAQDGGLLLALGGEDRRLLDALGVEDGGAAVAFCAHLLLHRLLDRLRRIDGLELDAVDADAPAPVASSSTVRSWVLILSRRSASPRA